MTMEKSGIIIPGLTYFGQFISIKPLLAAAQLVVKSH